MIAVLGVMSNLKLEGSGVLAIVCLATLLLVLFLQVELDLTGGELGTPLDDAWIHYQFARNLSRGDGFSYNPGEPTSGSTAPLWTLLLAGVGLFTENFLIPSLGLSAAFLILTIWLTYGFARSITGSQPAGLLAALGVTLAGRFLWAGLAGMETTAFAACSLAAVWAYSRGGLRPLPALLFALAGQLRPEGHALFALALIDTFLSFRLPATNSRPKTQGRALALSLLIYGAVAAPYALFSLLTTGLPLPNTFYAKAGSVYLFSVRTLRETLALHWQDNPLAFLLLPFGLVPIWRRSRLATGWFLGLPIMVAFVVDFTWHHGRYTLPLIPFQMIVAAVGAHWLVQRFAVRRRLAAAILLLLFGLAGGLRLSHWARMLGTNTNEVNVVDVALGHWLSENTPPDALVAVDDIGATIFLSQRRVLDLNGLVSPEIWPALAEEGLPSDQLALRLLSSAGVDYLAVFPKWHPPLVSDPSWATPLQQFSVETHSIIGEKEAGVYQMDWPYLQQASPQVKQVVSLGDGIQLLGYDLCSLVDAGQFLCLTLYWQSLATVNEGYKVFIHLLDGDGQVIAQVDRQPLDSLAPTHLWQPGDIVRDRYEIPLPFDLPAGSYYVTTGIYLEETMARLPPVGKNVDVEDNTIILIEPER